MLEYRHLISYVHIHTSITVTCFSGLPQPPKNCAPDRHWTGHIFCCCSFTVTAVRTYIHTTTCVLCRAVVLYLAAHPNSESRALFHHLLRPVASHFARLGHCIRVKGSSSAAWVVPTLHCQRMQSTCRTPNRLRLTIQSLSGC